MAAFGLYLLMLSLIVFYFFSNSYIHQNLPVLLKNFPEVTFEKGVLTAPETPVSVSIPQSDFKITFDASLKTPPSAQEMKRNNTLLLFSGNKAYMLSSSDRIEQTELPVSFGFISSQENLNKEKETLVGVLGAFSFLTSLFLIPMLMLFGFCLASAAGFFFKLFYRSHLPRRIIFKWAFFMLGPLSALWYLRLWINIPLFSFAQVILCIIYMQQIFNTLPEEK